MPTIRKVTTEEAKTWKRRSPWPHGKPERATPEEIAQAREALTDKSGISRIDQVSRCTHGWFARVYGQQRMTKMFSDMRYGGMREALAAAVAWRDEQRKQRHSKGEQSQHTVGKGSPTRNVRKAAALSPTIAIADDDLAICELLEDLLTGKGYQVVSYRDRTRLFDGLAQQVSDLLILDLHLEHETSGWEILTEIRDHPTTSALPVIASTTDALFVDSYFPELQALNATLIEMPFEIETMLAMVKQVLAKQ